MRNPILLLIAVALAVVLWGVTESKGEIEAHHKWGHQIPPLEILAVGQPIDCGALEDYIITLRKRWDIDKKLMKKRLYNPIFKEDLSQLQDYEDLFWLVPCSRA